MNEIKQAAILCHWRTFLVFPVIAAQASEASDL